MTEQDKMDVIHALKDLGFVQGAAAVWTSSRRWVQLESPPFFLIEPEGNLDNKSDYLSAYVRIKVASINTLTTVKVSELESPHTAKNKIDVLIDDIKNNPTPVKEAWVIELEQIKAWCDANDTIKERRANQLVLFNEAEKAETLIDKNASYQQNQPYRSKAAFLRRIAKVFDNPNKLVLNEPNVEWPITTKNQIIDKIDEVIGRGALYYDELKGLLEQLREL